MGLKKNIEDQVFTDLGRATEGLGLALKNRGNIYEMVANLEYAQANIRHIFELIELDKLRISHAR